MIKLAFSPSIHTLQSGVPTVGPKVLDKAAFINLLLRYAAEVLPNKEPDEDGELAVDPEAPWVKDRRDQYAAIVRSGQSNYGDTLPFLDALAQRGHARTIVTFGERATSSSPRTRMRSLQI